MLRKDPLVQRHAADFGARLRAERKAQNLSQERLGNMVYTSHSPISNMERGLVDPRVSDIIELARALGVHPVELLDLGAYGLDDFPLPSDGHASL